MVLLSLSYALATVVAAPPEAPRVAVFPPTFDGESTDAWKKDVSDGVVSALQEAGFEVVGPQEVVAESGVSQCGNPKCLVMVGKAVDADFVTSLDVRLVEKDYTFDAKVVDTRTGKVAAQSSEACELCGAAEAKEVAAVQATSLQEKIESLKMKPPVVVLETDPAGASVLLDGAKVGVTPMKLEVEPGAHEISFEMNGFVSDAQSVDAVTGIQESVSYRFPEDVVPRRAPGRAMLISGAVLTGVGVAMASAGAVFLVLDGNSYEANCTGDNIDAEGNCRNIWETMVPGAVFTGVGVAATAAGIGLIAGAVVRRKKAKSSRASAHVGFTGSGFVVSGRF